jgi:hypothetical protein
VKFPLEINASAGFASGREGDDGKHRIQALADVGWGEIRFAGFPYLSFSMSCACE